jgi:hypothetical protein
VQVVAVVVPGENIVLIIEGESTLGDAIPVSPDDGAEVGMPYQVTIEIVESENDVCKSAVSIGRRQRSDDTPEGRDRRPHPVVVGQYVQLDVSSVGQGPELLFGDAVTTFARYHHQSLSDDNWPMGASAAH